MVLPRIGSLFDHPLRSRSLPSPCRIVGFEELGNTDAFQTAVLELKLTSIGNNSSSSFGKCAKSFAGVIKPDPEKAHHLISSEANRTNDDDDKEDVFDLDE